MAEAARGARRPGIGRGGGEIQSLGFGLGDVFFFFWALGLGFSLFLLFFRVWGLRFRVYFLAFRAFAFRVFGLLFCYRV